MTDYYDGVAGFDQIHAEAIDQLREARYFFLATAEVMEEGEGNVVAVIGAGGDGFAPFTRSVAVALAAREGVIPEDVTEAMQSLGEARDHYLERSRYWRRVMLAAAGANLALAAFTLVRLAL